MTGSATTREDPWLVRFAAADPPSVRLFCFHHAGASASAFHPWQDRLPPEVELAAIQLPGREFRFSETLITDMAEIATAIATAIAPFLDRPFVFFGHSMGGIIAFNVIRELRACGLGQPDLLIASGRNAPQFKWIDAGMEKLCDKDFVAAVRAYNGTPEALLSDPDLQDLWLPRLRADLTISANYQHLAQAPLSCPILVLSGDDDHLVSDAGLDGWRAHTADTIRFVRLPGNHFFLQSCERRVLGEVNFELNRLIERTGDHYDHSQQNTKAPVRHA